jgi:hypothetical protein
MTKQEVPRASIGRVLTDRNQFNDRVPHHGLCVLSNVMLLTPRSGVHQHQMGTRINHARVRRKMMILVERDHSPVNVTVEVPVPAR